MNNLTPAMRQYMEIKNKHEDCIIFFRMGDFYETFYQDAKIAARELDITLTARGKGEGQAPLAGIPYHSVEPYIAKLVKKGYNVGIVEQTEDPKQAKGLVKRDLVRIITPGTIVESLMLDESKNNYVLSVAKDKENVAIAFSDISTGEFFTTEISDDLVFDEIKKINPAEIIYPLSLEESAFVSQLKKDTYILKSYDDRYFFSDKAKNVLLDHFGVLNLKGFGVASDYEIQVAGALLHYIKETQMNAVTHISNLQKYQLDDCMHLDFATIRNLELFENIVDRKQNMTLLALLDKTETPMGKRLLRRWISNPLVDLKKILYRRDGVAELKEKLLMRTEAKKYLSEMYDIERLISRVAYGNANPKDVVALKETMKRLPLLSGLIKNGESAALVSCAALPDLSSPTELIEKSIKNDPNTTVREGNIIKEGYNSELDELRSVRGDGKQFISKLEEDEREKTGIKSLKVKYNKVFGYYIEVTKANLSLVPEHYIRKQTQVNSERFITEELKEMETKILGAEERIVELEFELFSKIVEKLAAYQKDIQDVSEKLSLLDCLCGFAEVAEAQNYCKPLFDGSDKELNIVDGRHPVIEAFSEEAFVPNSCFLSDKERTMIITGPNLAGKSTFMRQVALICLLAQIGSYVPAREVSLPVLDRIFTRIGAYDDLVSGQSTFMVEMNETAHILNNATSRSLIVLDEIGRGTSTYDGVSLAWAIAEHIHTSISAKTLFATHYHQLNKLGEKYPGIKNYNIAVHETDDAITFLRKIKEGGTDKSYGIQVAKLAGVPLSVIENSKKIMNQLEMQDEIGDVLHKDLKDSKVEEKVGKKEEKEEKHVISSLHQFM